MLPVLLPDDPPEALLSPEEPLATALPVPPSSSLSPSVLLESEAPDLDVLPGSSRIGALTPAPSPLPDPDEAGALVFGVFGGRLGGDDAFPLPSCTAVRSLGGVLSSPLPD